MSEEPWYGVRSVFEHPDENPVSGEHWYEERVTLWRAASIEAALELADAEAGRYADENECDNTGLLHAFHVASPLVGSGTEVFSLIRGSQLDAVAYLKAFFDTGSEIQRDVNSVEG